MKSRPVKSDKSIRIFFHRGRKRKNRELDFVENKIDLDSLVQCVREYLFENNLRLNIDEKIQLNKSWTTSMKS